MIPLAILRYQGKRLIGCDSLAWLSQVRRMASTDYTERFVSEGHSALYAKYRASHSKEFYKFIVDHLREKLPPPNSLAIDVGCGTGSSTRPLAEYFDQVIGSDISETQLAEAQKDPSNPSNITFSVASFDKLPARDGSVDLVNVSEAIHWFIPIENFYKEVDRVLKPNGCLSVYEYGHVEYVNHPHAEELTKSIHELRTDDRIWKYTAEPIRRQRGLANITTPYKDVMRDSNFEILRHITLEDFIGEWKARSSFFLYYNDHPDGPGPLEDYVEKVKKYLGDKPPRECKIDTRYPVWLVMGRKPSQ